MLADVFFLQLRDGAGVPCCAVSVLGCAPVLRALDMSAILPLKIRSSYAASSSCGLLRLHLHFGSLSAVSIANLDDGLGGRLTDLQCGKWWRLWKHAPRHYRGGQEAGRATNERRSIHHVRRWNSQFLIEEY